MAIVGNFLSSLIPHVIVVGPPIPKRFDIMWPETISKAIVRAPTPLRQVREAIDMANFKVDTFIERLPF